MNYSEQVKRDAKAAGDYIREHGWIQGTSQDGDCRCMVDVTYMVCEGRKSAQFPISALHKAIVSEIGVGDILTWNDTPGRTKEEVLAVFDRIAGISTASDT